MKDLHIMAPSIIEAADLAAILTKFDIRRTERDTYDEYYGTKASLIAASTSCGLART